MKKINLLISLLFYISSFAQEKEDLLIPFLEKNKYGFLNEAGKAVISTRYDLAVPFYPGNDLTLVVSEGKGFMINRKGKKVIKAIPDFFSAEDWISSKTYPYFPVGIGMDTYCLVDSYPEFKIYNKLGTNHLLDKMGDLYFVRLNEKACLIDNKGKPRTKCFDKLRHFYHGEIEYVISEDTILHKSGLIDEYGSQVLECVYDKILYTGKGVFDLSQGGKIYQFKLKFNENYKPAELPKKHVDLKYILKRKAGKIGLVDSLQQIVLPIEYDKLYPMSEQKYLYTKNDESGLIDLKFGVLYQQKMNMQDGMLLTKGKYPGFVPYSDSIAFINFGKTWTMINNRGTVLIKNIDGVFIDFQNINGHIAGTAVNSKLGVLNDNGKFILEPVYDKIECISDNKSFVVFKDNVWFWLNAEGKLILDGFDDYRYVLKNHLFVKKSGNWFFVSDKGEKYTKD